MTKKMIIEKLRGMGYKANYKNVLVTQMKLGNILLIQNGYNLILIPVNELN